MNFETALQFIRTGAIMRRADWRAVVTFYRARIRMAWPSGVVELWRPTLADIEAEDWERVK